MLRPVFLSTDRDGHPISALTYLDHEMLARDLPINEFFCSTSAKPFFRPDRVQLRRRVERRSRMAAAWRPPAGLVLDGREHGGTLRQAGANDDQHRFPLPLPVPPTAVGKRKREASQLPCSRPH